MDCRKSVVEIVTVSVRFITSCARYSLEYTKYTYSLLLSIKVARVSSCSVYLC